MHESICLVVDVASALEQGTAEGNTFMVSARVQEKGPASQGDPQFFIRVTGVHDRAGRPISEVTLNWSVTSLQIESPIRGSERHLDARRNSQLSMLLGLARVRGSLQNVSQVLSLLAHVPGYAKATAPGTGQGGRLPPVLVGITGPAVDEQVIFPAMYGSPDFGTYGWYWSASVDTHKVGLHRFTMHLALFRDHEHMPEILSCNAQLEVCKVQAVNGFTGADAGWLPLPEHREAGVPPVRPEAGVPPVRPEAGVPPMRPAAGAVANPLSAGFREGDPPQAPSQTAGIADRREVL